MLQFLLFFMGLAECSRSDVLGESGDDLGIDAVGFGQNAETFGEVANLTRIDNGDQMAGVSEFGDDSSLIPAGGFDGRARRGAAMPPPPPPRRATRWPAPDR